MAAERTGNVTTYPSGSCADAVHEFNADIPADCDYVLVTVGIRSAGNGRTVTVEVNSVTASLVAANHDGSFQADVHELVAPATGGTVPIKITQNLTGNAWAFTAAVIPYRNVDQDTPRRAASTEVGDEAAKPSISPTSVEGDYVFASLVVSRPTDATVDSPGASVYTLQGTVGTGAQRSRHRGATRTAPSGSTTTIEYTLADTENPRLWRLTSFALIGAATAPDPATISRETADIAAQEQTDTTAHVRVDSVDTTAGNTHRLWGHTSDLGSDPATWEASATDLGAVTTNDLVGWTGRSPNTNYYFAVVSTDSGSNKTQSAVLNILTAYARPTSPTVVGKTADSVTVSWTDASGGAASHQVFYRVATDPLSDLVFAGTIPAGETIQFQFVDLDPGTEYSFEALAWNGAGRLSGLTAITATPAAAWGGFEHIYQHLLAGGIQHV